MRFIESICFKDGHYLNLDFHNERWTRTHQFFFKNTPHIISEILPDIHDEGTIKVRVVYDQASHEVSYLPYQKKNIQSLKVVETEAFDYSFKFEDRKTITELKNSSATDEIIISINGMVKDSTYSNLVFWDGSEWSTPADPLLEGVRRAQLLAEGKVKSASIALSDLPSFEKVSLINAMLDLGEMEVPTSSIHSTS